MLGNQPCTNLHALLTGLDSSDVASHAATDDDEVLLLCKPGQHKLDAPGSAKLPTNVPEAEEYPRLHRDRVGAETTTGRLQGNAAQVSQRVIFAWLAKQAAMLDGGNERGSGIQLTWIFGRPGERLWILNGWRA